MNRRSREKGKDRTKSRITKPYTVISYEVINSILIRNFFFPLIYFDICI